MNKLRSEYLYNLVGVIKEKKKANNKKRKGYRLLVEIFNLEEKIPYIQVWEDKLANEQIWTDLENNKFVDKRYCFECQNWMGQYRLINWREIANNRNYD